MTQIGRNQPCPCGSGRKFKLCHGREAQPAAPSGDGTWRRLRRVFDGHPARMFRFIQDVYGPHAVDEAWEEFLVWDDDGTGFDAETPHMQVFMPWFFHAWAPDPHVTSVEDPALCDRPPTAVLLERRGRKLDPLLRRYLEACVRTPFSFHEIVRCEPGVGFRSRDVFVGVERDVLERSASRTFKVGDLFFGQVVTCDGVTIMEACGPVPIPPGQKTGLIDLRERMARSLHPPTPETLADWANELRDAYLDITDRLLHPPRPVLQNTDGDDLVFHRLDFEISSPRKAFDALKDLAFDETEEELLESADRDDEGRLRRISFAWKVAGNPRHRGWDNTVLAHLEIDGPRLVANVNSAERAARFRRIVEERLGSDARHRRTEVQSVEEAMAGEPRDAASPGRSDDADPARDPEVRRRLSEMMATHYESWVSEEIPALDGRTPLEAVRTPAGRAKVESLVRQIERDGQRMDPPLDENVLRSLRRRLGLV